MMGMIVSVQCRTSSGRRVAGQDCCNGAWKTPVTGRIFARRLNLDGDGQGDLRGHGGEQRAIMGVPARIDRHWAKYLGRSDLVAGNFGENYSGRASPITRSAPAICFSG